MVSGKTRTREKYRVVYTDHQRLELEKEFHFNRYITIRRKSEMARYLGLSERQVKIWFQNRRAKERKQLKKLQELYCSTNTINTCPAQCTNSAPNYNIDTISGSGNTATEPLRHLSLSGIEPVTIKQESTIVDSHLVP